MACLDAGKSDLKEIIAHSVEASLTHLMGKIDGAHLIYREDDELIGVVLVKGYWNMVSLFVAPSHQRKGIATHLVDRALEICSRKSPKGMVACNSSGYASTFYKAYEFVSNGKARALPGECKPYVYTSNQQANLTKQASSKSKTPTQIVQT